MRKDGFVICNCCGKKILVEQTEGMQEFLHIEKEWGYFSKKDGKRQKFDLCESCFDKWTANFLIPMEECEVTEFL